MITNSTTQIPQHLAHIYLLEDRSARGGGLVIVCRDCRAWAHVGASGNQALRHSKRCDCASDASLPECAGYRSPEEADRDARRSEAKEVRRRFFANGLLPDELHDAVKKGYLSQDEAMNSDF